MNDWVIHMTASDDVLPQPDELTALRHANAINKAMAEIERTANHPFEIALVKDRAKEAV